MAASKYRVGQIDFTGINLPAGSALLPSILYNQGPLLTTPVAGAKEFFSNIHYSTPVNGNRGIDLLGHLSMNNADFAAANVNTSQPIFQAANDRINVDSNMSYLFELYLFVTNGVTTATKALSFNGGTCTFTSIRYNCTAQNAVINVTGTAANFTPVDTAASTVILATGTTSWWALARGIIRINAAGTLLPQFQFSAAPGAPVVVKKDSYMLLIPIGSGSVASVGAWS